MNKPCARCQHPVYPLEKLDCLGQTWHKMCFYCEECETVLTVNNFKSFEKRPYCHAHCPKPNKFTSVLETPLNLNVKQQSVNASENKYREAGEKFRTEYHWDMQSREMEHIRQVAHLSSQVEYTKSWDAQKEFYHLPPDVIARNAASVQLYEQEMCVEGNLVYTETPEYKRIVQAQKNVSDVQYKREFKEKRDQFTSVAESWDLRHARVGSALASEVKYREAYEKEMKGQQASGGLELTAGAQRAIQEQQEGRQVRKIRGSFPANETPGYRCAKQAHNLASDVKYKAGMEQMKGAAQFHSLHSDGNLEMQRTQKVNKLVSENEYRRDVKSAKGHSVNYCDTQQFKSASKAGDLASDLKYKEAYETQVKGHYAGVGMVDKRTEHCMKVANLASKRNYRAEYEEDKAYVNFPATTTPAYESQKKQELYRDPQYRQRVEKLKFTSVSDTPEIAQARINANQLSDMNYRADYEKNKTRFTITRDNPQMDQAKASGDLVSDIKYHEQWEKTKGKGFEMKMDDISLLAACASGALASDIKYREAYEKTKGRSVGSSEYDTKTLHSMQAGKLMNEREYKKGFEATKGRLHLPMDMLQLLHAQKAQSLASDRDYRTLLHRYTALPSDLKVEWAKKAYQLQSDTEYRADLAWMRGVNWAAQGSVHVEQAKRAGELVSDKSYRQHPDSIRFTSVSDTPEMNQAKISYQQAVDRLYREGGEAVKHGYTGPADLPELARARANAHNISESGYRRSWEQSRARGYKLHPDAIPFQAARASREISSDYKYKEAFERHKGHYVGASAMQNLNLLHLLHSSQLQSDREYKKGFEETKGRLHLPADMLQLLHAQNAQSLASDRDYRTLLHRYTALPSDLKVEWAKKAYQLQSDNLYRAEGGALRGVGWTPLGSLQTEYVKRAGDIMSERKYRQHPDALKFTVVADSVGIQHAKNAYLQSSERRYRQAGMNSQHHYTLTSDLPEHIQARINTHNLSDTQYRDLWRRSRSLGYTLHAYDIPFQAAKSSQEISSQYNYRQAFEREKGHHVGAQSAEGDQNLLHCLHASQLSSGQGYRRAFDDTKGALHLPNDMLQLLHAQKAQSLASDRDYRTLLHRYTALPEDLKIQAAKRAYQLQSESLYKAELSQLKGVGWLPQGSVQMEGALRAGQLVSEKKYRQQPHKFQFTSIADSPDILHAKASYEKSSELAYRSAASGSSHTFTLPPDHPELLRARANALHASDIAYRESSRSARAAGYDLRLDALPFQTARASRDIASDYKYKETFARERGRLVGALGAGGDARILHGMSASRMQSSLRRRRDHDEAREAAAEGHYSLPADVASLVHARQSQERASDVRYRQRVAPGTATTEQLSVKHAQHAHSLQSEKRYKADLTWMRGVGWVPPGSHKVEVARRAAERAASGADSDGPQRLPPAKPKAEMERQRVQGEEVMPDAFEVLHSKRRGKRM